EINALVARAIERTHRCAGERAGGRLGPGKQAQFGRVISSPGCGKDFSPAVLGVAKNRSDELSGWVVRRTGGHRGSRAGLLGGPAAENLLCAIKQHVWINAEIPTDQRDNDHNTDAKPAGTTRHPARCARFAIIFNISAAAEIIYPHGYTRGLRSNRLKTRFREFRVSLFC